MINTIDHKNLVQEWLASEYAKQKKHSRYRKKFIGSRKYPHFDANIDLDNAEQVGLLVHRLSNSNLMASWKFFPFIRRDQRNRKYRHKSEGVTPIGSPIVHRNQKKFTHIKSRPIMYASHQDACLLAYFAFVISKEYEEAIIKRGLRDNVIAYRSLKRKNNVDFAHKAFRFMEANDNFLCILIDVKGFFDNIPHDPLQKNIEELLGNNIPIEILHVLKSVTNYRYVIEDEVIKELKLKKKQYYVRIPNKGIRLCKLEDFNSLINNPKFVRTNRKKYGIPQGSPASGLLANIFLLDFDSWMISRMNELETSFYQRYSDDILIICPSSEAKRLYGDIKNQIKKYGLNLSPKKTEAFEKKSGNISNAVSILEPYNKSKRQNLQYLGLEWSGSQIIIRPGTLNRRFRPKNKLSKRYWDYHQMAIAKVGGNALKKQFANMRRTVKKMK